MRHMLQVASAMTGLHWWLALFDCCLRMMWSEGKRYKTHWILLNLRHCCSFAAFTSVGGRFSRIWAWWAACGRDGMDVSRHRMMGMGVMVCTGMTRHGQGIAIAMSCQAGAGHADGQGPAMSYMDCRQWQTTMTNRQTSWPWSWSFTIIWYMYTVEGVDSVPNVWYNSQMTMEDSCSSSMYEARLPAST